MSAYQTVLVVILVVLVGIALYLRLPPRRSDAQDYSPTYRGYAEDADRDDERHWLGGFIYSNADDPRLFVPKRFGLGWTLNFGHPQGKLLLIGLVLLILVLVVGGPLLLPGSWGPTGYHPLGRLLP